jgi:hypothetical protein
MRSQPFLVATGILALAAGPLANPPGDGCADAAFAAPQRPYVAFRRLEAGNLKSGRHGWMDVLTELGADGLLVVEVLNEGGSDYIRTRVLRAALESEKRLVARRQAEPLPAADRSTCGESQLDESGLLRVPLRPARSGGDHLVIGHMFLEPGTGDLVRVAGRLAKNPSFWVSQVDVEWTYARVHKDIVLPVSLHSVAKVKVFGPSTFNMTYDYRSVDGQAVSAGSLASR